MFAPSMLRAASSVQARHGGTRTADMKACMHTESLLHTRAAKPSACLYTQARMHVTLHGCRSPVPDGPGCRGKPGGAEDALDPTH